MDRKDPLKHSRHKRMPQVWRMGQDAPRAVDALGDEFRVTVFLTNPQADRAEREAVQTGLGDLQSWCQATLRQIINRLDDGGPQPMIRPVVLSRQPSHGAEIVAELDIPDDPAFYSELVNVNDPSESVAPQIESHKPGVADDQNQSAGLTNLENTLETSPNSNLSKDDLESKTVEPELAILGDVAFARSVDQIMTALRSGLRPLENDVLLVCSRLENLANEVASENLLSRKLVRPLYRLAMESQVLITEVHPRLRLDLSVVTFVRRLQSAVGRILDI